VKVIRLEGVKRDGDFFLPSKLPGLLRIAMMVLEGGLQIEL
jgi:hypothetical protein